MLRVEQVPRRSVVPGAISQPDQIEKLVAVDQIYAGEQVSTSRFRPVQEQGVQAQLKGNLRALEVPATGPQLLNGTLKDGDRVDILGNWLTCRSAARTTSAASSCATSSSSRRRARTRSPATWAATRTKGSRSCSR